MIRPARQYLTVVVLSCLIPCDRTWAIVPWENADGSTGFYNWYDGYTCYGLLGDPVVGGADTLQFLPNTFLVDVISATVVVHDCFGYVVDGCLFSSGLIARGSSYISQQGGSVDILAELGFNGPCGVASRTARLTITDPGANEWLVLILVHPVPCGDCEPDFTTFKFGSLRITASGSGTSAQLVSMDTIFEHCPGDVNDDQSVNLSDFSEFLLSFGVGASDPLFDQAADFNLDGVVNLQDFATLQSNFGTDCMIP